MDFRHLEYVIAVADERSFSKAARRLLIAQPSLSQLIRKVESDLRVTLFDRSRSPIEPTEAGQLFVARARVMLNLFVETKVELRGVADGASGKVTVGAPLVIGSLFFPTLLGRCRTIDPPIHVVPVESPSRELEELMSRGNVEFSIMTEPTDRQRFHFEALTWDDFVLAVPQGHELAREAGDAGTGSNSVAPDRLGAHPLLLPKQGGVRSILDAFFAHAGIRPRVAFESRSMGTLLSLVSAGMGISVVPRLFTRNELDGQPLDVTYVGLDAPPSLRVSLGMVWRRGRAISRATERVMDVARDNVSEMYRT